MARQHPVVLLDALMRDEWYRRSNLPYREYSFDICSQWLKNHWEYLEVEKDTDDLILCIWIDLNTGIDALPEPERTVVRAYAEGYRAEALVAYTGHATAGQLVQSGTRRLARYLQGLPVDD